MVEQKISVEKVYSIIMDYKKALEECRSTIKIQQDLINRLINDKKKIDLPSLN